MHLNNCFPNLWQTFQSKNIAEIFATNLALTFCTLTVSIFYTIKTESSSFSKSCRISSITTQVAWESLKVLTSICCNIFWLKWNVRKFQLNEQIHIANGDELHAWECYGETDHIVIISKEACHLAFHAENCWDFF